MQAFGLIICGQQQGNFVRWLYVSLVVLAVATLNSNETITPVMQFHYFGEGPLCGHDNVFLEDNHISHALPDFLYEIKIPDAPFSCVLIIF